jgi:membrane-bound ClpP family serine protease
MMNYLIDPNVAYVMLVGGLLLAVLATFTPGTGLLELGALVMLGLAGLSVASLGVNWWAGWCLWSACAGRGGMPCWWWDLW